MNEFIFNLRACVRKGKMLELDDRCLWQDLVVINGSGYGAMIQSYMHMDGWKSLSEKRMGVRQRSLFKLERSRPRQISCFPTDRDSRRAQRPVLDPTGLGSRYL